MRPHPLLPLALASTLAAALTGCLLSEEDCGLGFEYVDGRCLPERAPRPFYPADAAAPAPDTRPPPDLGPRTDAAVPGDRWSDSRIALLVDRTPITSAARTPATPGADIDAVQLVQPTPAGDIRVGFGDEILEAVLNDPFGGNINRDPDALLGLPDGRVGSLGPDGGFAFIALSLERPPQVGDVIVVVEQAENRGVDDTYVLYLCREPAFPTCAIVGQGRAGISRLPLEE